MYAAKLCKNVAPLDPSAWGKIPTTGEERTVVQSINIPERNQRKSKPCPEFKSFFGPRQTWGIVISQEVKPSPHRQFLTENLNRNDITRSPSFTPRRSKSENLKHCSRKTPKD